MIIRRADACSEATPIAFKTPEQCVQNAFKNQHDYIFNVLFLKLCGGCAHICLHFFFSTPEMFHNLKTSVLAPQIVLMYIF